MKIGSIDISNLKCVGNTMFIAQSESSFAETSEKNVIKESKNMDKRETLIISKRIKNASPVSLQMGGH